MSVQRVSKKAGVSVATVSRVINHSPHVSPKTVAIVKAAMERIGYVPPPVEKRQRRRRRVLPGIRQGSIALLFPDVDNRALRTALSGRFMHGVGEILRARGLNMIVTPLDAGFAEPPCLRDGLVDAVIVRGLASRDQVLPMLGDLPCVWLLDGDLPLRGDQVLEDNGSVARMAIEHLRSRGCERVAVMNPMGLHYGYRSRCEWFAIHARRSGLSLSEFILRDQVEVSMIQGPAFDDILKRLGQLVADLVETSPRPQGVFLPFPDDLITFVYRELQERGVKPGRDIHIVCCSYDPPRLATLDRSIANIDILPEAMGRAAVETLMWRMRHPSEPQRRVMVMPSLVGGRV